MIIIIRHKKERISKCSLEPLKGRPDVCFYTKSGNFTFQADQHIVLCMNAPVLSRADTGLSLLILDSTWRLVSELERCLTGAPIRRSLPAHIQTAYPRINKQGADPHGGLASIEALYVAQRLLGNDDPSLLEHYHWKDIFLKQLHI